MSRGNLVSLFVLAAAAALTPACPPSAPPPPTQFTAEAEWVDLKGLQERLAAERGRVVVVNYWATWCEPCREEFPELIRFDREWRGRGVTFFSVSLDTASVRDTEVKKFLAEHRPAFAVFIRRETDDPDTFINGIDPQWSGVLPATFIYDREGQRRQSLLGPTTAEKLEAAVKPLLAQ
ncbi:MAG TPA: TlpA disulfide reductase family protein [Candidatus Xenobia bacterium]|nr:TlpA disulfide reductase family protein [Candidatus Xenobia bacterium]